MVVSGSDRSIVTTDKSENFAVRKSRERVVCWRELEGFSSLKTEMIFEQLCMLVGKIQWREKKLMTS